MEGRFTNFNGKESKVETEINQRDPENHDNIVKKHSSFNPFRKLGGFTRSCLKKLGVLKAKESDSQIDQIEPEVQNESEVESEDFSQKILIGIEVYMPTVDVENNRLIPPKFDRPIFKYRSLENDKQPLKSSDMVNELSNVNRIKKRSKFSTSIKDERPLKTTDMANDNSNCHAIKKESNLAAIIKGNQTVKSSDMANKNSDLHISKKGNKFSSFITDKQSLKASDMVDENSDLHINKKQSKFLMIIKDVEKSISRVSQMLKPFKGKRLDSENPVMAPEIKISSKIEQSNSTISKETNYNRSPTSLNSVKSKFLGLKFPSIEKEMKSKQKENNIKQKKHLKNSRNTRPRLKSRIEIESKGKSPTSFKPTTKKRCKISSKSSTSDTSSHLSLSQPVELCTLLTDIDGITRSPKYKNETCDAKYYKTIHKHQEPKVKANDLTNVKDTNEEAEMNNQEIIHEFHHPKTCRIKKKVEKIRLPYSKAEIRSKFSESNQQFLEENTTRRHLPLQVDIDKTPIVNSCRQLPMKQHFLQNSETSHFSRSSTMYNNGSRTTTRGGKERRQKRTAPNPSFSVAGRRRLLQLMESDV
ncbi:unnamed protein product [Larinioides sclopetarius]|uniref:Uncharacterized protein n=1 Tax=Larinioides sclopetarius TaxID=280406 RepID=A0AAV1YVK0_9ARAC